jgi:hypothetical protein
MPTLPLLEEGVVHGMRFIPSSVEVNEVLDEMPAIAFEGNLRDGGRIETGMIISGTYNETGTNPNIGNWICVDMGGTSTTSVSSVIVNGTIIYPNRFHVLNTCTTVTTMMSNYVGTFTSNTITNSTSNYFVTNGSVWTPAHDNAVDWAEIRRKAAAPQIVKKSTRSSIKRALKLMMGMGFEEDVRVFLNGDSIEISHPNSLFKFVITKHSRSLIRYTEHPGYSTPYRLELYTKSDVHIANLCVYMEQTPVLDQILGVAMFIKSGSEEMILKEANWSGLLDDMETREILALEYPYLEKKLQLGRNHHIHNSVGQWAA